jgi:hypothetical protein
VKNLLYLSQFLPILMNFRRVHCQF